MSCNTDETTIQKILIRAIRMIKLYPEEYEDIPGHVQEDALMILNEVLDNHSSHGVEIPYIKISDATLTAGSQSYTWENVVDIPQITVIVGDRRYPIEIIEEGRIFNRGFSTQTTGRPREAFFVRTHKNIELNFYPIPDTDYQIEVVLKGFLTNVVAKDDLSEFPLFWNRYLRYAVARELVDFYPAAIWTSTLESKYKKQHNKVMSSNQIDYTFKTDDALLRRSSYRNDIGVQNP